jgi:hypothetical protein
MESNGFDRVRSALMEHGRVVNDYGGKVKARCPSARHANGDQNPSLEVKRSLQLNKATVICYTGCTLDEILTPLGLSAKDIYDDSNKNKQRTPTYRDKRTGLYTGSWFR